MFLSRRKQITCDRVFGILISATALLAGTILFTVVVFLTKESWPAVSSGKLASLFSDLEWQPGSARDPRFGIVAMLAGTSLVTLLSACLAIPLGVGGAIYQHFYAPARLTAWHSRLLELLAGIPSVVFGFWGLTVLVPAINAIHPPGQSLLAAGLVLSLMILPTVGLTAAEALRSLEPELFQNSVALGLSRPTTILRIAVPAARRGIIAGCVLAITRAMGETLAVVMVCGNIAQIPGSLFDPVRPVTATIALEMGYASFDHKALLFAAGLILVLLTGSLIAWQMFRNELIEDRGARRQAE